MRLICFAMTSALTLLSSPGEAMPPVGAAPKGDATAIATRIIKYNFPSCRRVTNAARGSDCSIRAACDGARYVVFTVFNAKQGKLLEVALNCTAAKELGVDC